MRPPLAFAAAVLLILAVALALRLPRLGDRPFHGDEAVHAFKFRDVWERGQYHYDPEEYHGPTLYYAAWPVVAARGPATLGERVTGDPNWLTAVEGDAPERVGRQIRDLPAVGRPERKLRAGRARELTGVDLIEGADPHRARAHERNVTAVR